MSLKFQDPMTSYRLIQLPLNMQSGGLQHSLGCLAHTSTSKCFVVVIDSDFELSRWLVEADELAEARSISIIIEYDLHQRQQKIMLTILPRQLQLSFSLSGKRSFAFHWIRIH